MKNKQKEWHPATKPLTFRFLREVLVQTQRRFALSCTPLPKAGICSLFQCEMTTSTLLSSTPTGLSLQLFSPCGFFNARGQLRLITLLTPLFFFSLFTESFFQLAA
jgi:hypothetical protein